MDVERILIPVISPPKWTKSENTPALTASLSQSQGKHVLRLQRHHSDTDKRILCYELPTEETCDWNRGIPLISFEELSGNRTLPTVTLRFLRLSDSTEYHFDPEDLGLPINPSKGKAYKITSAGFDNSIGLLPSAHSLIFEHIRITPVERTRASDNLKMLEKTVATARDNNISLYSAVVQPTSGEMIPQWPSGYITNWLASLNRIKRVLIPQETASALENTKCKWSLSPTAGSATPDREKEDYLLSETAKAIILQNRRKYSTLALAYRPHEFYQFMLENSLAKKILQKDKSYPVQTFHNTWTGDLEALQGILTPIS